MQNTKHFYNNFLSLFILTIILVLLSVSSAIQPNSDAAGIYTESKLKTVVQNTWSNYKSKSIIDGNKVVDKNDKSVIIEAQSYALLRAAIMNDKSTFDNVYSWTKLNMQVRPDDKLFAFRISPDQTGNYTRVDLSNATDGDLDVGLALVMADKKWSSSGNINYSQEVKTLANAIFKNRVLDLNGNLTLLPFNSQKWKGIEILNPSYFSPAHYKLFSAYDTDNNWGKLSYDTYNTLDWIKSKAGLYPDWIVYDYNTKQFRDAQGEMGAGAHFYGYDAFRIYWRLSLDQSLFNNINATRLLTLAKRFFENEIKNKRTVYSQYQTTSGVVNHGQDQAIFSGAYFVLSATKSRYTPIIAQKFYDKIDDKTLIYAANENYYSQNWGWFALADLAGYKKSGL
jgi:endoglucanase